MVLKLYNTLTRKKEIFKPIKDKQVGVYGCGPTVYWYQHIGNLRRYLFEDLLMRVLKFNGYKVKHVINITDVGHLTSDADEGEDKIEKAAKKEGKTAREITDYYFKVFHEDLIKLNVLEPDVWPRASEHINEQIDLIKILERKGYTYITSDGVYFDTSKFKDYSKFARLNVEELKAEKRVGLGEKKNKTDFALWKFSSEPGIRQQEWNSPWGVGFPGWHIECSAMSLKYLGKHFDIHTGGPEHINVHHTNEIAQSECAFGEKPWVNYWLHGAWLLSEGKKISKSSGGLYTLSELEKKGFNPLDFRYFCLTKQYGKPLDFTIEKLKVAANALQRLKNIISKMRESKEKKNKKNIEIAKKQFLEIINDDLNSSKALSFLWEILRENKLNDAEKYELAIYFDKVFGLDLGKEENVEIPEEIERLLEERKIAREKKDWKRADELRDKINKKGFVISDTEKGVEVKKR